MTAKRKPTLRGLPNQSTQELIVRKIYRRNRDEFMALKLEYVTVYNFIYHWSPPPGFLCDVVIITKFKTKSRIFGDKILR